MRILFWSSLALILYAYAGYPCALALLAKLRPRKVAKVPITQSAPGISIVLDRKSVV